MFDSPPLDRLKARREHDNREIADHERAMAYLKSEMAMHEESIARLRADLADLETTERVLRELDEQSKPARVRMFTQDAASPSDDDADGDQSKPAGTPPMPEMIRMVLSAGLRAGFQNMEPKDIAAEIRRRWWRDAPTERVSPIAWRMFKRGELGKVDSKYFLIGELTQEPPLEVTNSGSA